MYLLCAECKYLGYTLSKKGISPDHEKLKAVETYPIPKKLKDVRAFLGFIGFYRKFIHNFSEIAKPLTDLTKKNTKFVWSSQCSSAFQILKQKLISPPILAYPNYNYEFILTTDASNVGISAILSQQINGEERPIAFSSRVLSETETRLCTTERELLAILFGCKQYRYIIFGYKFKIITDHSALQWLQNLKDPHSKLYRWSLKLSEFDFYIEHRSGKNIAHADALSRYIGCINTDISPEYYPNIDFLEIAQQQAEDEQCRRLAQSKNYTVNDSGLLINVLDNNILVPSKMRDIVLQLYHDNPLSGHYGRQKTYDRIKTQFSWPDMTKDVENYVKTCYSCATRKTDNAHKPPIGTFSEPTNVWQAISIDVVGPLEPSTNILTGEEYKYILTIICQYSRYLEMFPITNQKAETIAQVIVNHIFTRYGTPKYLLTDLGTNFTSTILLQICALLKIKKVCTTPYHPASNGRLERIHRDIANNISHYVQSDNNWHNYLPLIKAAHNSTKNVSTNFTPHELVFGTKFQFPWILNYPQKDVQNFNIHTKCLHEKIQKVRQQAKHNNEKAKHIREKYYNKSASKQNFYVGDYVYLKNFTPTGKFRKKYHGPYQIYKIFSNQTALITLNDNERKLVHLSKIKKAHLRQKPTNTHKMILRPRKTKI